MDIDRVIEIERKLSKLDVKIRAGHGNVAAMKLERERLLKERGRR